MTIPRELFSLFWSIGCCHVVTPILASGDYQLPVLKQHYYGCFDYVLVSKSLIQTGLVFLVDLIGYCDKFALKGDFTGLGVGV